MSRVEQHPVLLIPEIDRVTFYFGDRPLEARRGEMISSALFAHGIRVFGLHPADQSPQGIFCANGQCAQCLVICDGRPVKACMEPVREGMKVSPLHGYPEVPEITAADLRLVDIKDTACDLLIVGGGPAGMGAAIEAADAGLSVILIDDKNSLGGKLVLQTHLFFGAVAECYAGTRGVEIAGILAAEVTERPRIRVMTSTMAMGVFKDGKVGVASSDRYQLITPRSILVAAGAREKALTFPGCDLPGVYGAGAFQTLLNRDLIRPAEKLFVVGGGNVGLIAAYHALQAGITVVGLCEALPDVGGYWVHADKIRRMGVPIYTATSVVSANGKDCVESVTVAAVDKKWNLVPGTHRTYACDTLLIAVGLERVSELYDQAKACRLDAHLAGDAEEIAEASAAMFSGRLAGRRIARLQGRAVDLPERWEKLTALLKSKPGRENFPVTAKPAGRQIFPVLGCLETIPCNPCAEVCPHQALRMPRDGDILPRAEFDGTCTGCTKCVAGCPGLAITLVDLTPRADGKARVTVPYELPVRFNAGDNVAVRGWKGEDLGAARVIEIYDRLGRSPCRIACPAEVRAQGYIQLIRQNRLAEALEILRRDLPLPGVCGRVCYHPCEDECVRKDVDEPVAICSLKRYIADWGRREKIPVTRPPVTRSERIAIIGSGPAGLACANELCHRGYAVTVFEAEPKAGGLLRWGIPAYRLPEDILDRELDDLRQMGIEIRTGTRVDDPNSFLSHGYAAVFLAPGVLQSMAAGIPGEDQPGVYGMLDFLKRVKKGTLDRLEGTTVVIGGGNSAIDSAQTARRLGCKDVRILYRRSREQMPAHDWEISQAEADGVRFEYLVAPVAIQGSRGKIQNITMIRMKLGAADSSGRPRPMPVAGSEFVMAVNHVILAIGQQPQFGDLAQGLTLTRWGTIQADPVTQETDQPGIFAGGDAATGASTVVAAFGAGKRAAESIDRWLRQVDIAAGRRDAAARAPACWGPSLMPAPRVKPAELAAAERTADFGEIIQPLDDQAALREAQRCLGCGSISEGLAGAKSCLRGGLTGPIQDRARLVILETEPDKAQLIGGISIQPETATSPIQTIVPAAGDDDVILCRCERVSIGQVRRMIRAGVTDFNQLKAVLSIGMGACGSKTCGPLLASLFRREGVPQDQVTAFVQRPLTAEVPLGFFAGQQENRPTGPAEGKA